MKCIQIIIKYIDIINRPVLLPVNNNAPTASILTIYEWILVWTNIFFIYSWYAIKVNDKYDEYTWASDML